jgi:dipeptidase
MCDTFVVVEHGRVLFGKNSDRDPNEAQVLSWVPARSHAEGSALRCTWIDIPQIVTREPVQEEGLLGMDLVRLGLERADTANVAKDIICELIARHGQGGRCGYDKPGFSYHNSFIVADAGSAWVIEAAGMNVATKRIDQGAYAISNGITLQALSSREDRIRPRVAMAAGRRRRVQCLAESATSLGDAMAILRDHGKGNERPRYQRLNGAMSAPCMHAGGWLAASQSVGSFVAELGSSSQRYWATGTAAPCLGIFRPVSMQQPHDVGTPTGRQDDSLWWTFETIHRALLSADAGLLSEYIAERDRVQALVLESDEAAAWQVADSWLSEWHERLSRDRSADTRPSWLRRYWQRVTAQAASESKLTWRAP